MKIGLMSLILVLFFFSTSLWAANIYVAPVTGTGKMDKQQLETIRELIKVQVSDSQHKVVHKLDEADFYIQTKLIHFQSYTLSMSRWQGGEKLTTGQWKAKDLNELEGAIQKAVPVVLAGEAKGPGKALFDNSKSLGDQAEEKMQKNNYERVPARKQIVIGFGPAYFSNMNSAGTGVGVQTGYVWNIDDHVDLGLLAEFALSLDHGDAHMFNGKIAANYFFASSDVSPFVGAAFGYGYASAHDGLNQIADDSSAGFALSAQLGVKFFRTSTVNLGVSGEYTTIFDGNSIGNPSMFLLRVGLFY
ncbi:MAG: acyloxyacyl hydrolase [Bdellovibrionales bacterium]|nr:acyloxyacyl hydrolase [Bdellovibrionales bacterium]